MDKKTKELRRVASALESMNQGPAHRDTSKPDRKEKLPLVGRLILFMGSSTSMSWNATMARRAFPIRGYVGPNGGGKSLAAVKDILPSLMRNRTVLSTVRILDHRNGNIHPCYEPFLDFDQLLDLQHASVVADEIVGIANSRGAASLAPAVQNVLVQLRRRDLDFSWTAPNWARADIIIREVSQAVTECRGYYPARPIFQDGEISQWRPKRVFRFRTFDTADFEEWTSAKRDKITPLVREWFKGVDSDAFSSYDTLDQVSMVSHASAEGLCDTCGHSVRKRFCSCRERTQDRALERAQKELHEHHASSDEPAMVPISEDLVMV